MSSPGLRFVNGTSFAVHSDHLNTPRRMTNSDGQAVWQWSYSAFGDDKPTLAKNRFANLDITPNPGTTSFSEVVYNKRYQGQYFDNESGLFYNYFRSYSAERGRYTQPDPIGLDGGWNRIPYANLNPLTFTDPDGLNPLAGAINGGRLGAAAGSPFGPPGAVIGGVLGAGAGAAAGWWLTGPMLAKPPDNAYDPSGPKHQASRQKPMDLSRPKGVKTGCPIRTPVKVVRAMDGRTARAMYGAPLGRPARAAGHMVGRIGMCNLQVAATETNAHSMGSEHVASHT